MVFLGGVARQFTPLLEHPLYRPPNSRQTWAMRRTASSISASRGRGAETEAERGFHQIVGQVHRAKRRRKLRRAARTGRADRTGHAGKVQRHPQHLAVVAGKGDVAGLRKACVGGADMDVCHRMADKMLPHCSMNDDVRQAARSPARNDRATPSIAGRARLAPSARVPSAVAMPMANATGSVPGRSPSC